MTTKIKICFLLILLTGCYSNKVFNEKGEFVKKTSFLRHPKSISYTNDKKLIKGFFLNSINDTIEKRCFNYLELKKLKKTLTGRKINVTNIAITKSIFLTNTNCIGIYYLYINEEIKEKYKMIPVLKFDDKFAINTSYIEGTPFLRDTAIVIQNIKEFEIKYKSQFADSTLMGIINSYKYGIILSRKYFYR